MEPTTISSVNTKIKMNIIIKICARDNNILRLSYVRARARSHKNKHPKKWWWWVKFCRENKNYTENDSHNNIIISRWWNTHIHIRWIRYKLLDRPSIGFDKHLFGFIKLLLVNRAMLNANRCMLCTYAQTNDWNVVRWRARAVQYKKTWKHTLSVRLCSITLFL